MLSTVNEASFPEMICCYYELLDVFVKGMKGLLLHSETRNI
jgi:hypothetical protein